VASNGKKENILSSWKEIAAYLDCDVRTCVRWEQRYGLPIHRLDREAKSKVFAYREQIDEWLASRASASGPGPAKPVRSPRCWRPVAGVFGLTAVAAAVYFLFVRPSDPAATKLPSDFLIERSELVIVDGRGRELWRRDTRLADLQNEDFYRTHSKPKEPDGEYNTVWPFIRIGDLDGDRTPEVLFSIQTTSENREGTLFCYDARGAELWRFDAGRALDFGGKPFRREYRIIGLDVDDYDVDGSLEVLVISAQKPDWPCQVVLLDAAGRLEGEFWNAGYIMDASLGDVDGDGAPELVLSGVNNEYRRGCLAVFEPGQLRGSSPQLSPAFRSPDLGAGGQSAYVLFPANDIYAALYQEGESVNSFWIHPGGGLTAVTFGTQIFYDLDSSLSCPNVTLSHVFKNLHRTAAAKRLVTSTPDAAYERALADSFLYYRAGRWAGPGGAAATGLGPAEAGPRK